MNRVEPGDHYSDDAFFPLHFALNVSFNILSWLSFTKYTDLRVERWSIWVFHILCSLTFRDENGCTALLIASRRGDVRILKILLDYYSDINAIDKQKVHVISFVQYSRRGYWSSITVQFLVGLQSNFDLWIDDVRLPVCLSVRLYVVHVWLNFAFKFWNVLCNLALPS